jgi:hypothetical protein
MEFQMYKSLVALAILSVASAPVAAQTAPTSPATPAKPQMVKKRICETTEEDSYSRLGGRKICHVVEVPAPVKGDGQNNQQAPAGDSERG